MKYTATIEEVCQENGTRYCITKQAFEWIKEILNTLPFEACEWDSITDINGKRYSGCTRGAGAGSTSKTCNYKLMDKIAEIFGKHPTFVRILVASAFALFGGVLRNIFKIIRSFSFWITEVIQISKSLVLLEV